MIPRRTQLIESKALTVVGGSKSQADDAFDDADALPDEQWRDDESSCRFIQFSFNTRYFDLDLPNTTLFRAEAELILRRRSGFFYVTDRREFEHPAENADHFNPLRKIFVYGDDAPPPRKWRSCYSAFGNSRWIGDFT